MKNSLDRYLYTISLLKSKQAHVCALDVGRFLGVKPSGVSLALQKLRDQGCIMKETDGNLSFSQSYKEEADRICERVAFFRKFLTDLGLDCATADHDAVILGRKLSDVSYQAFRITCEFRDD